MQCNCVIDGSTPVSTVTTTGKNGAPKSSVQHYDINLIPEHARDLIDVMESRAAYYDQLEEEVLSIARSARHLAREIRKGVESIVDHYEQECQFRDWKKDFHKAVETFIETGCVGKEYDSCYNSPCTYASSSGCSHPDHPKNKRGSVNLEGL